MVNLKRLYFFIFVFKISQNLYKYIQLYTVWHEIIREFKSENCVRLEYRNFA